MQNQERKDRLDKIFSKADSGQSLEGGDIRFLLNLEPGEETEALFQHARKVRSLYFGHSVFLYGFIYFSTYCRNNCAFCFYRRSNRVSKRYRKSREEIILTAGWLAESGVHLLDLTMGEDPYYFTGQGFTELLSITADVKTAAGLPLMISPGVLPRPILKEFSSIGAEWYACYQETHNRDLYRKLRLEQDYEERLNLKLFAHELGMLTEEGLLAGIGETDDDLIFSFKVMREIAADQVRVMSFVPQKGTPLEGASVEPRLREMLIIAIMRVIFPDRLIPASLDVDGIAGLQARLNAGANVITSIIPPDLGFMGVSQSTLDICEGGRTVAGVKPILESCGLTAADREEYALWVEKRRALYTQRGNQLNSSI